MVSLAQEYVPREIGTSLIGSYTPDGFDAVVLGIAPVPSDSKGQRGAFQRGVRGLKCFFRALFEASHGEKHYVGEWHSHPFGPCTPSPTDDANQNAISNSSKTNCPESILIILGGDLLRKPETSVFVYSRGRGRVNLLPEWQ
jgi:integrative and conjugative element protein (TIGR02256 family)